MHRHKHQKELLWKGQICWKRCLHRPRWAVLGGELAFKTALHKEKVGEKKHLRSLRQAGELLPKDSYEMHVRIVYPGQSVGVHFSIGICSTLIKIGPTVVYSLKLPASTCGTVKHPAPYYQGSLGSGSQRYPKGVRQHCAGILEWDWLSLGGSESCSSNGRKKWELEDVNCFLKGAAVHLIDINTSLSVHRFTALVKGELSFFQEASEFFFLRK